MMLKDPSEKVREKVAFLGVSLMTINAGVTISPALPKIRSYFSDTAHVELMVPLILTIPALMIATASPVAGIIADKWGRRRLLILSTVLYGLAGGSGLVLGSLVAIICGRALLGFAIAGVMTSLITLVAENLSPAEREKYLSFQAAFMGVMGFAFVLAGGFLTDLHWRAPFAIYFISFLVLPGALMWLKETIREAAPVAPRLKKPPTAYPWLRIGILYFICMTIMIAYYMIPLRLPFYLEEMSISSGSRVGLAIGITGVLSIVSSLTYPRIRAYGSYIDIFGLMFLLFGLGFQILARASQYGTVLVALGIIGLGFGWAFPNTVAWLAVLAPEQARGRLFGGMTTSLFLGQFISPLAIQPVATRMGLGGTLGAFGLSGMALMVLGLIFFTGRFLTRKRG